MSHRLFCIVGASGVGKTTLARGLARNGVPEVVSHTSRPPRRGEIDGVAYRFVTPADFEELVYRGSMLEHVTYGGHSYGVSRLAVADALAEGPACVVVEAKGAAQLKGELGPTACVLFLAAPALDVLRLRMAARGDSAAAIEARLATVDAEVSAGLRVAEHVIFPASEAETLRRVLKIIDAQ